MSINVPEVWDDLAEAVASVTGLNVFRFVPESIAPPTAIVTLDNITYDNTKARGTDRALFKVVVAVSKAHDESARDAVAGYLDGSGGASTAIPAAINALTPAYRCASATLQILNMGGLEYLAPTFDVNYVG